jgi:hypothetical protein
MFAPAPFAALWPPLPLGRAALLLALSLLLHAVLLTALRERLDEPPRADAVRIHTIEAAVIFERRAPPQPAAPAPRPRPKPRAAPAPSAPAPSAPPVETVAAPAAEPATPLRDEAVGGDVAPPEPMPAPPVEAPPAAGPAAPRERGDLALELAEIGGTLAGLPVAATYVYRTSDSRYPSFTGSTTIEWRVDAAAQRYETRLKTTVFEVPIAEITSTGAVRRFGLAPERYVQKTATRAAVAANVDWSRRVVTFSRRSDERPAREGIQDRLSFQFQLMALAQNLPSAFAPGATISMQVAGTGDVETYDFVVVGSETLTLEQGPIETVKLDRPKGPGAEARVEAWLAPARRWLPVKLRFTDRRGNVTESVLQSANEDG